MVILIIISGDTPQTSGEPQVVPGGWGMSLGPNETHPAQHMRGMYLALCQCAKVSFKKKIR